MYSAKGENQQMNYDLNKKVQGKHNLGSKKYENNYRIGCNQLSV